MARRKKSAAAHPLPDSPKQKRAVDTLDRIDTLIERVLNITPSHHGGTERPHTT